MVPEALLCFSHRLSCSIPQSPGAPTLFFDPRPPGPQCSSQIVHATPSVPMVGMQPSSLLIEGQGDQLAPTPSQSNDSPSLSPSSHGPNPCQGLSGSRPSSFLELAACLGY